MGKNSLLSFRFTCGAVYIEASWSVWDFMQVRSKSSGQVHKTYSYTLYKKINAPFVLSPLGATDLRVGLFIRTILKLRGVPENLCVYSVMVWLFNPFTFTIRTRGNCEPIVCAIILWIIIFLMNGNLFQASFWYSLVVHLRIYPIIYALPIIMSLDPLQFQPGTKPVLTDWNSREDKSAVSLGTTKVFDPYQLWVSFRSLFTRGKIMFGLISASAFFFCTGIFFYLYQWEFLHEALLYHLTRTDPRHNFSIYFIIFISIMNMTSQLLKSSSHLYLK